MPRRPDSARSVSAVSGERGFSLLELMIVVALMAIGAMIMMPSAAPVERARLELAASEVADAVRYARSEAVRTGNPHGARIRKSTNQVQVFRADMGTDPPTDVYDVYHPVSKRVYDLPLDDHPMIKGVKIIARTYTWSGICNTENRVVFDAYGVPHCVDPISVLLVQYEVALGFGSSIIGVLVDGETGRVTVQ